MIGSARRFSAGDVIFRQGEPSSGEAFLIREGRVEVRRVLDGEETIHRTLKQGDLFGEVALFRRGPHSATAIALEAVTVLVIRADRLEDLVRTNPDLSLALIRQLARMAASDEDAQRS
jgi:CRP-like cAMP-binding protein